MDLKEEKLKCILREKFYIDLSWRDCRKKYLEYFAGQFLKLCSILAVSTTNTSLYYTLMYARRQKIASYLWCKTINSRRHLAPSFFYFALL